MEEINKGEREHVEQRHLPEDLITKEILPWLPVKTLYRCKSISKYWYSFLSSPNFLLNYVKQPLFPHLSSVLECLIIQFGKNYYLYYCDPNDDNVEQVATYSKEESLVKLHVDFNVNDTMDLVGSSNGLVCLADAHSKFFILWNPATNKWHKYYSQQDYEQLLSFEEPPPYIVDWGFGYVSSQNDHKVVKITTCTNSVIRTVHVFSMRTNSWRRIECGLEEGFSFKKVLLVKEKLYWSMIIKPLSPSWKCRIVAFDLALETFEVLPTNLGLHVRTVMGGYLALGMCTKDGENGHVVNKIVILKGPENEVSLPCCELNPGNFENLIGFTKTGKMFVSCTHPPSLDLVDATSKQTLVTFEGHMGDVSVESYVPSQISPSPTAVLIAVGRVA